MTPARYQRILAVLNRRQPDLSVILEGVHKPHNLSAIQRTADAIGILEAHAVTPKHRYRGHKATAKGSEKWVRVRPHTHIDTAIDAVRQRGMRVVAAHFSDRAVDFRQEDYTRPIAILMGTEKFGVSEAALAQVDGEITVPMVGMVASLNVSVAAAVVFYEAQRQRQLAGLYDQCRLTDEHCQHLLFEWGYPRLAVRYASLGLAYPRIGDQGEILDPVPESVRRRIST